MSEGPSPAISSDGVGEMRSPPSAVATEREVACGLSFAQAAINDAMMSRLVADPSCFVAIGYPCMWWRSWSQESSRLAMCQL